MRAETAQVESDTKGRTEVPVWPLVNLRGNFIIV